MATDQFQVQAEEGITWLSPDELQARLPQSIKMERTSKNNGSPFVEFECVHFEGMQKKPYKRNWIMDLDAVTGTVDHIRYYENKRGWKIVDFGNLRLDENERGVFQDTVDEHKRIYLHCSRSLGYKSETDAIRSAAARKLAEAEARVKEAEKQAEARIKALEKELEKESKKNK